MNKRNNIVVVGGGNEYVQLLRKLGNVQQIVGTPTKNHLVLLDDADLVVFTGGADVSPSFYGETAHTSTVSAPVRDEGESLLYHHAAKMCTPMVGICRGAQLITVLNNGKLIQDVKGHRVSHHMIAKSLKDGKDTRVFTTSTHHQMMSPFNLPSDEYVIVGKAEAKLSTHYKGNKGGKDYDHESPVVEPEIVLYPYTDCLAIQGHPEVTLANVTAFRELCLEYMQAMMDCAMPLDLLGYNIDLQDTNKFRNVIHHGNVLPNK